MKSILLATFVLFSAILFASCKKKEKVGYEKVFHNIYKGEQFLFDFYDPAKCYIYAVWEDGTIDSVPNAIDSYEVRNDSIIMTYIKGTIHPDKLILKSNAAMAAHPYIKIN